MLPSYKNIFSRLTISSYGLLFTFLMPFLYGIEDSYSMYHLHNPLLLKVSLAILGIGLWLHKNDRWTVPAIALVCVGIFDVSYPMTHNISAFLFFLSSSYIIFTDERISRLGYYSLLIYPLLLIPQQGLFWFEFFQTIIISIYHILYAIKILKLKIIRKSNG